MLEDTIIAVSTPLGYGGLGVVRLSGTRALSIAERFFQPKRALRKTPPRRPVLGNLVDREKGEVFDEAFLTYFPGPRSYTREDMVEISCHGSPVILEEIVRLGIHAGARHAGPGEFTLRAYLNGRIDILQAEAVNTLITAPSLRLAKLGFRQLEGRLSRTVSLLRSQLVRLLSQIEASIEFPDEELPVSSRTIAAALSRTKNTLRRLVSSYDLGRALSEGLSLVIAGRANVGKSTLFNALLERERSIVTPYPGTTRDYIRESFTTNGAVFNLVDTAGMEHPSHPVEKEGIRRGKKLAEQADGILLVCDASRAETDEDLSLVRKFQKKKMLLLFNKIDLPVKMDVEKVKRAAAAAPSLEISALKGTNLEALKENMVRLFAPRQKDGDQVVLHLRQKLLFQEILEHVLRAETLLQKGHSEEVCAEEIRSALPLFGRLTGEIRQEEVIEAIFSRFCVGK